MRGLAYCTRAVNSSGVKRAVLRPDHRVLLEGVLELHVVGEQVHLERAAEIDFPFQGVERGAGTARHVVLKARHRSARPIGMLRHGKALPRRLARINWQSVCTA